MKEKLKPCPFCGSENVKLTEVSDAYYKYRVICCGCEIRTSLEHIDAIAIAAWNRRAGEQEIPKEQTCSCPPTDRQMQYINAIVAEIGVKFTGTTKEEATAWLFMYAPVYQRAMEEYRMIDEIQNEVIDGQRDW